MAPTPPRINSTDRRAPGLAARALAWGLGLLWLAFAGRQIVPPLADGAPAPAPFVLALGVLALGAGVLCVFGAVRAGVLCGAAALAGLAVWVSGVLGDASGPVQAWVTLTPDQTLGAVAVLAGVHALTLALAWPVRRRG